MQTPVFATRSGGFGHRIWVFLTVLILAGCASPSIDDYSNRAPELVPISFSGDR